MDSTRHYLPQQPRTQPPQPSASFVEGDTSSFTPTASTIRGYFQPAAYISSSMTHNVEQPASPQASPHSRSASVSSTRSLREASRPQRLPEHPARRPGPSDIKPEEEGRGSLMFIQQDQPNDIQEGEDGIPQIVTCDFVRKLYKLLEDRTLSNILCWGPQGDFFIIKDVHAFTVDILPRTFKHSNFASFVRQLNKYDFHKMKPADVDQPGENNWLFRHHDFHAGAPELLENIKRKVPSMKKYSQPMSLAPAVPTPLQVLQAQIQHMACQQAEMTVQIRNMERDCVSVLDGMVSLQRDLTQHDGALRELVQHAMQYDISNGGAVS